MVTYDFQGIGLWFVIIPMLFFVSFYLFPPRIKLYVWGIAAGSIIILGSILFAGFTLETLRMAGFSAVALIITVIIFQAQGRGRILAAAEILFAAVLYFAYLSFSRAYEDIAIESAGIAKMILLLSLSVFIIHSIVLFLAAFPNAIKKRKRELILAGAILIPVIIIAAILLPSSFITNDIEVNSRPDQLDQKITPIDDPSLGPPGGPNRGDGKDGFGTGRDGKLQGLSPDDWQGMNLDNMGRSNENGMMSDRQFAVMVVASKAETLYVSYKYKGSLHQYRGFRAFEDEPLNKLSDMRLLETWYNPDKEFDLHRYNMDVFFLSTLPQKLSVYQPVSLTPTIYDISRRPFSYSYESVSDISFAGSNALFESPGLSQKEKMDLKQYLEIPFGDTIKNDFKQYLDSRIPEGLGYYSTLLAILENYSSFQYELGYDENVDVQKMYKFLTETHTGDCTEFANASAIIARFYGIPTRVVNGFLAAKELQLPQHRRGLYYLRNKIDILQEYSLDDLLMVTTSHYHAWFQAYIPPYGWIDMEATSYAIPPPPGGNPNNMDLVIPLVEEKTKQKKIPDPFPWGPVGLGVLFFLVCVFDTLYLFKFIRIYILEIKTKIASRSGVKALGTLLIIKLVNRGFDHKPKSMTFLEYSEIYPALQSFSTLYTELLYRVSIDKNEFRELYTGLRQQFREVIHSHRKLGFWGRVKYIFSLKGLRY